MTVKQTLLNELSGRSRNNSRYSDWILRSEPELSFRRTHACGRGLIRDAGWLDARFRVKTNGATPYQDAYDSTYSSELLPFGELVLFRIPLPHTRRTNQKRTICRGDSGWDKRFWCGRLDEDNAHIIVTENGREIPRTVRRLPLSQRVGVFC